MVHGAASEWGREDGTDPKSGRASVKRKMAKQMRFLNKLEETQRVLSAKKTISKKRRKSQTGRTLNDLSSLSEFLPSITSSTTATTTKILRSKAKQKIVFFRWQLRLSPFSMVPWLVIGLLCAVESRRTAFWNLIQ